MLENHAAAQFPNLDQVMFQQDGGPTPWAMEFRDYINAKFPGHLMVWEVQVRGFFALLI
jgi:hypothetical protein